MPTNVTPTVGPWVTPLQIPSDGEGISSASVLAYVQEIANRLELIRNRAPGLTASGSPITLPVTAGDAILLAASTNWRKDSSNTLAPVVTNLAVSATETVLLPLRGLVPGQVVQSMGVLIRGAAGHAALPAAMPTMALTRVDLTAAVGGAADPTNATVTGTGDASANTAAYQVNHLITTGGGGHVVLANNLYFLRVLGESGANSLLGLKILSGFIAVSG